jgi:hypothetical protein
MTTLAAAMTAPQATLGWQPARARGETARWLPQRPEEGPDVLGERGRLLDRREVAAGGHDRPAPEGVDGLGQRSGARTISAGKAA